MTQIAIHSDGNMYVKIGNWFKVVSVFTNEDEANKFLEMNKNCGVIMVEGEVIVVADNAATGIKELSKVNYDIYGAPV